MFHKIPIIILITIIVQSCNNNDRNTPDCLDVGYYTTYEMLTVDNDLFDIYSGRENNIIIEGLSLLEDTLILDIRYFGGAEHDFQLIGRSSVVAAPEIIYDVVLVDITNNDPCGNPIAAQLKFDISVVSSIIYYSTDRKISILNSLDTILYSLTPDSPYEYLIIGKWSWVYSEGAFGSGTITFEETGNAWQYDFFSNSVKRYDNDTLTYQGSYSLYMDSGIKYLNIQINVNEHEVAPIGFLGTDTMYFNWWVLVDGYRHVFIRND